MDSRGVGQGVAHKMFPGCVGIAASLFFLCDRLDVTFKMNVLAFVLYFGTIALWFIQLERKNLFVFILP